MPGAKMRTRAGHCVEDTAERSLAWHLTRRGRAGKFSHGHWFSTTQEMTDNQNTGSDGRHRPLQDHDLAQGARPRVPDPAPAGRTQDSRPVPSAGVRRM